MFSSKRILHAALQFQSNTLSIKPLVKPLLYNSWGSIQKDTTNALWFLTVRMKTQRLYNQCYQTSDLQQNPLSTLIQALWTHQWLLFHCLFFLLAGLITYGYFTGTSFKNFKQWFGVTLQLSEAVCTHSQIINPEDNDVLWLCGFLGNGIFNLQTTFLTHSLATATTGYRIKETFTVYYQCRWIFGLSISELTRCYVFQCFSQ